MTAGRLDDAYWGGWTEHGELLHLAATSQAGLPRSACGLILDVAYGIPGTLQSARCRRCEVIEQSWERDELVEAIAHATRTRPDHPEAAS